MTYIATTLSAIRVKFPCKSGYKKLVTSLGGARKFGSKTPFPLTTILASNGIDDALWVACKVCGIDGERVAHTFSVDCADHVLHIYEQRVPDDARVRNALAVKRRWVEGDATDDELVAARDAASDAARDAAWGAANAAAWAGWAAAWAVRAAAMAAAASAAGGASWDAVRAAAWAANAAAWDATSAAADAAAGDAAWDAAQDAASASAWAANAAAQDAAIAWQTTRLRELLTASDNEVTKMGKDHE